MRPLICTKSWWETPDTRSFLLATLDDQPFRLNAGQFVVVTVTINGQVYRRAYSLGPASNNERLQLTVKRVEGGTVSNWLLDVFAIGHIVNISEPMGSFCPDPVQKDNKLLMLSAGCGIVPICSVATETLRIQPDKDIFFIHCARDQQHIIYHQLLDEYAAGFPGVSLNLVLKDSPLPWSGSGQRLDEHTLPELCPDLYERKIYLCGPERFLKSMNQALAQLKIDPRQLCQESIQANSVH